MARSRERKPGQGADAEREDSAPKPEGPAGDSPHRAALDWQRRAGNRAMSDAVEAAQREPGRPLDPATRSRLRGAARPRPELVLRIHTGARGERAARLTGARRLRC